MKNEQGIVQAFALIAQYAEKKGWIPIGHRNFRVGDFEVTVNGTPTPVTKGEMEIPPFHALVDNQRYVGILLMHPHGGTAAGYHDTEAEFIAAMEAAIRGESADEGRRATLSGPVADDRGTATAERGGVAEDPQ